jgi:hypothetical protein
MEAFFFAFLARKCSIKSVGLTNELMDSLLSNLMACSFKPFNFPWHPYLGNPSMLIENYRNVSIENMEKYRNK